MHPEAYGHWPSAWSSQQAAQASRDIAELRAGLGGLIWSEFDPAQAQTRLWHWTPQTLRCLTPETYSVRSRVYEYGGGAFCIAQQAVIWVNEADQQIYSQALQGPPRALTQAADCRYGDLFFAQGLNTVLAVEEQHQPERVIHRLVAIDLTSGARQVLAEGCDFYAAPTLSPDAQRLAWIEWDRPSQPWLATRLCLSQRQADGHWQAAQVLAGAQADQALQQPCFDANNRLWVLSDLHGFWQPWHESDQGVLQQLPCQEADHAAAPWQLGARNYLATDDQQALLSWFEQGVAQLACVCPLTHTQQKLARNYSRFRQLCADQHSFYCIAASSHCSSAVLAIDRHSQQLSVLYQSQHNLPQNEIAQPQAMRFAVNADAHCHGFFYAPHNSQCAPASQDKPPLLLCMHGGPTSACYPVFDPRIQFWTQRGFAVLDLNYRGSSGYGRDYRLGLAGNWGLFEVEDAQGAVRQLTQAGLINPQQVFIRGSSAGGYSVLLSLIGTTPFRGGASLYGISDPLRLRASTHKFEADYLDWLIGDPIQHAQRYQARTAIQHVKAIQCPVIFLQGAQDPVVLPEQTQRMVQALQQRGVTAQCRLYAQERHGFRHAHNIADALEAELSFYQQLLSPLHQQP